MILKKQEQNDFEKYFFNLMNNSVFQKTIGNLSKHRRIKHATTENMRSHLVFRH